MGRLSSMGVFERRPGTPRRQRHQLQGAVRLLLVEQSAYRSKMRYNS